MYGPSRLHAAHWHQLRTCQPSRAGLICWSCGWDGKSQALVAALAQAPLQPVIVAKLLRPCCNEIPHESCLALQNCCAMSQTLHLICTATSGTSVKAGTRPALENRHGVRVSAAID